MNQYMTTDGTPTRARIVQGITLIFMTVIPLLCPLITSTVTFLVVIRDVHSIFSDLRIISTTRIIQDRVIEHGFLCLVSGYMVF